jgi:hypothetical protein
VSLDKMLPASSLTASGEPARFRFPAEDPAGIVERASRSVFALAACTMTYAKLTLATIVDSVGVLRASHAAPRRSLHRVVSI